MIQTFSILSLNFINFFTISFFYSQIVQRLLFVLIYDKYLFLLIVGCLNFYKHPLLFLIFLLKYGVFYSHIQKLFERNFLILFNFCHIFQHS